MKKPSFCFPLAAPTDRHRCVFYLLLLFFGPRLLGQTAGVLINPISYFQLQEGSSAVSWSQSSAVLDSSGNSDITFKDSNGGTSTMAWNSAGTLITWSITLASGATQAYTDAAPQGQLGSFNLVAGTFGTNNVVSINGQAYVPNGDLLQPAQSSSCSASNFIQSVVYAGTTWDFVTIGTDYAGRMISTFASASATCTAIANQRYSVSSVSQKLQFYWANGTTADYAFSSQGTYTFQADSTAQNLLSQINGFPLTSAGNTLFLPVPLKSFVYNGTSFTLTGVTWFPGYGITWTYTGSMVSGEFNADSTSTGAFHLLTLDFYTSPISLAPGSTANTYQVSPASAASLFTAINGVAYVLQGSVLVPQGPVSGFAYGGSTYQFTGFAPASDGNYLAQYQTSGTNPQTATAEYSPASDALVSLSVNSPSGGTATYVSGASVGQPGAYVWSSTSSAANLLTTVNGGSYSPAGDSDLPATAQTTNGVFEIKGNFMSLGSWSNNGNQSGVTLSYYDGQPVTDPANIEFTASRPGSAWLWDAATSNGTGVTPAMQLDQSSRLLLYPEASSGATSGPAVPPPAVILDPSTANPSEFTGIVRFDGSVRIAPQGDLSMGQFTQDAFPAQPTK